VIKLTELEALNKRLADLERQRQELRKKRDQKYSEWQLLKVELAKARQSEDVAKIAELESQLPIIEGIGRKLDSQINEMDREIMAVRDNIEKLPEEIEGLKKRLKMQENLLYQKENEVKSIEERYKTELSLAKTEVEMAKAEVEQTKKFISNFMGGDESGSKG